MPLSAHAQQQDDQPDKHRTADAVNQHGSGQRKHLCAHADDKCPRAGHSIAGETTLLAKPVIGTMLPAPAYLPILSYTPNPVSSDAMKIRQMLVAVEALCMPHFSP